MWVQSNSKRKSNYASGTQAAPAVWDGKTTCDLTPAPCIGSSDAQAGADTAPLALRGGGCCGCGCIDLGAACSLQQIPVRAE